MSATSAISPPRGSVSACFSPSPSMSIAPLLTKCLTCWKDWPGQPERLGQIVKTASSGLTVSVPQAGHFFGGFGLRALLFLRGSFGETTWGITSPARITTTSSPSRTSLRARSSSLWRVAVVTVTPPTWTGSSIANGTRWPVRPTFQTTFVQRRRRRRRRELPGDRPARLAADHAELAPERPLVDLDDDAVDLVVELLAPLLPPVAALDDALDALVVVGVGIDLEAALAQPLDLVHVGRRGRGRGRRRSRRSRSRAAVRRPARGRAGGSSRRPSCAGWRRSVRSASARRSFSALKAAIGR